MCKQHKLLVVDDNEINLAIMQEILGDDYELALASSGEEALTVAGEFMPDLILLDVMMPGIDGYETCRRLRANPKFSQVKVIIVSARAMQSEREQGYNAGADDYVTKPFNEEEILTKVRKHMQLSTIQDMNHEASMRG